MPSLEVWLDQDLLLGEKTRDQEQHPHQPHESPTFMIVACPNCRTKITAPDHAAGRKAKCPSCGAIMMLPAPVHDAETFDHGLQSSPSASGPLSAPMGSGISDLLDETDEMYSLQTSPASGPQSPSNPFGQGVQPSMVDPGLPRRPCPACGEMIIMSALKCDYCGELLDPGLKRRSRRGGGGLDEEFTGLDWVLALLLTGIGCIIGVIWTIEGKPKGPKMLGICLVVAVLKNSLIFLALLAGG